MAESAEGTNLEDLDLGDMEEVDLSALDTPDAGDELDLPDMDDSPFDLEGNVDDLEDLDLETEAVGNREDTGTLTEAAETAGELEDAGDFDFGEDAAEPTEKAGLITEEEELVISDAEEETPGLEDNIDLASEDEAAEPAVAADSGERLDELDGLDDMGLDDNIDLANTEESGVEPEADAEVGSDDAAVLAVDDEAAEATEPALEVEATGDAGETEEPGDWNLGEAEPDLVLDDVTSNEETPEPELAAADMEEETAPQIADEEDPFSLEDDFADPELAGDDPFDLAETEPELADFTDGEASDEGAGEPDLLEEVDTGIGDLAELDEAAMEEPAPEDAGGDNAIGLEEVALGTAAAAMAGAATSNTSTDSAMNGDKDESGALVAQAGPERLLNFQHEVVVEVARTKLTGEEITQITYGSIIELDKVAGEPVNLVLDGKVIAHGEMVLINEDKLGIRIIGIMQE